MKRFGFWLKWLFAGIGAMSLVLFAALTYGLAHLKSSPGSQSHEISPPVSPPVSQPISQPRSPRISQPDFSPPKSATPKGFVESAAEKEYERKNGVEIVHRKDGTTYTRKARSKNAK